MLNNHPGKCLKDPKRGRRCVIRAHTSTLNMTFSLPFKSFPFPAFPHFSPFFPLPKPSHCPPHFCLYYFNNGIIIQIMLKDKDSKQSIQVTIRVRPLSEKQINEDSRICVRMQQNNSLYLTVGNDIKKFTFDSICFNQSQQQIFNRVGRKCTIDCLEGYNCTIFAYGQTGAGKTYTMMGVNFESQNYYEHRGLIPRTMEFLFECIDRERQNGVNFVIRCSFLEIYNEQIIDLLNKANNNLQLREDTRKGVYVQGITEEIINRGDEAMEILYKGSKSRHVGSTFYNETSSRSHSVFTMQIESKYTKNGVSNTKSRQFNFIDLAGSERTKQSTGERLKEGCNINKSLMNLASVINALSEVSEGKTQHVNYRNSKLTFLLKDSLGGNSKTNLIANISPATIFCQETISTLGFARRAKLIKREKASINEDSTGNLESMKNQIKRLKQEVITLMSRCQTAGDNLSVNQQQKPSEMTAIMHQYVQEEIDKQTRLQLEILKLNDRIVQLQNGIKQYSNNEIHLRMIINVYEDKINRLKGIEKLLNENIDQLDENDEQSKIIVTYFKSERNNFLKQLENLRNQAENNKFLKELLKEAKVMKEDGEDESLKDLLVKNTTFLNIIRTKLDEMKPQNIESGFHSEYQKKIAMMEEQYNKRNEEYQERYEQINLELADFKSRNEENERLLEDAISGQISLEEKVKEEQEFIKKVQKELEENQNMMKQLESQKQSQKAKSQEIINQVKCQISDRDGKIVTLRKEVDALKSKLQKAYANETALKEEFQILEEEKYKVDKILLQNIEELRESKNNLLKSDSEIALLQRKVETLFSEKQDMRETQAKLHETIIEKDRCFKTKLEEIQRNHAIMLKQKEDETNTLNNQIKSHQETIKNLNEQLSKQTEELETIISQQDKIEQEHKALLANKDQKLRELMLLINEKELNGNETNVQLNQLKLELINAHSEKESIEGKYKKTVDELREKLSKEHLNYQSLESQMNERVKMYDNLSQQYQHKKKECIDLTEAMSKVKSNVKVLEEEISSEQEKLEEVSKEVDSLRNKEKQYKLTLIEMKNELFVSQKNSEIELDALKSQISLKDQQIEQFEKEQSKSKHRLQKQIEELTKQLENTQQSNRIQEESMKKSMENHLTSKEKRLSEMRLTLSNQQEKAKQLEKLCIETSEQVKMLSEAKTSLSEQITSLLTQKSQLFEAQEALKMELNELKANHQKELQENEEIHNEQIDQKNEQIQSFMLENESLINQATDLKKELENINKLNQSLLHQISVKNDSYKEITEQTSQSQGEILKLSKEFETYKQAKQQEILQITEQAAERVNEISKEHDQLQQKMIELNGNYEQEQEVNEEMLKKLETYYEELKTVKKESNNYINTISLLTQENCSLNQELKSQFDSQQFKEKQFNALELKYEQEKTEMEAEISKLSSANNHLNNQLISLQTIDNQNKQKLTEVSSQANELTLSLQQERETAASLFAVNQSLENKIKDLQANMKNTEEFLHETEEKLQYSLQTIERLNKELFDTTAQYKKVIQSIEKFTVQRDNLKGDYSRVNFDLAKAIQEIKVLTVLLKDTKEKQGKQINKLNIHNTFLTEQNKQLGTEIINSAKHTNELTQEIEEYKQTIAQYEANIRQLLGQNQRLGPYKQKCEQQASEIERIKHNIDEERASKERIFHQLSKEKESSNNLKMLIQNKSAQNLQLQLELEEKDSIYKKLVEKIAKFQGENKKASTSEHYLKTIELLEKSRAEQIQLRRQNEELKKVMMTMKETIEQKENQLKEVNHQSEVYCSSMHKRLEEIQNDYVELQRNHEKLVKERKLYSHDNEQLKEQIKNLKLSVAKITQKNEEMQGKIKKASLDYIQLQKEYEEIKRNQSLLPNNNDEKTIYINRLKAEVAALKTEKVLLTETLNKEREEKTKLKAEMRFGKQGNSQLLNTKLQYDKKMNENKNLTELIFEIISQLKICVNEPKAKLEVIRSIILGAIKQKNTEIKNLKDKIKEYETQQYRQVPAKSDYSIHRENRELKALSISNANKNIPTQQSHYKFEKEKDPSFLNNNSRQKMKEFEKYYAKFKYEGEGKAKNP